jgi:hypothetical protein
MAAADTEKVKEKEKVNKATDCKTAITHRHVLCILPGHSVALLSFVASPSLGLLRGIMDALAAAMNATMGGLERRLMGTLTTTMMRTLITTVMRRTLITNSTSRKPLPSILRYPFWRYILHLDT